MPVASARHERVEPPIELVENHSAYENAHLYEFGSHRSHGGGLSLPRPEHEAAPPRPQQLSTRLPDAVPDALFREPQSVPPRVVADSSTSVRRGAYVALAGIAVVVVTGLGLVLTNRPPPTPLGTVSVVSDPEGADIFMDGAPTGKKTPAELSQVPAWQSVLISVSKAGFKSEPEVRDVSVGPDDTATAFFALAAIKSVRIQTEPSGADIRVDGVPVSGRTPIDLHNLVVGSRIRIEAELPDYLTKSVDYLVTAVDEPLEPIVLREAVRLSVITEPAGAMVRVGGRELGLTPLYDEPVAKGQRLRLRIQKPGYRAVTKTIRIREDDQLDLSLREVPLTALKLRGADRHEARRLDRALGAASREASQARRARAASERSLQRLLDDPRSMFAARAKAERSVDKANDRINMAEERLIEARAAIERFRARVLAPGDDF